MVRFRNVIYFVVIFSVVSGSFGIIRKFILQKKSAVLSLSQQTGTVPNITARVGEYQIGKLTGWTSPFAEVQLTGQALARKTVANVIGFFSFEQIPIRKDFGELCLTSQDVNQLPGSPVCLSPPPASQNIEIRDVLLSPTISIQGENINYGETAKASGMTYPNSDVQVYIFSDNSLSVTNLLSLVALKLSPGGVYATGFPVYKIKSNQNGYFEFNLPSVDLSVNRIYVSSVFNNNLSPSLIGLFDNATSPKSFTLIYKIFKNINLLILLLIILLAIISLLLINNRKKRSRVILSEAKDPVESPMSNGILRPDVTSGAQNDGRDKLSS